MRLPFLLISGCSLLWAACTTSTPQVVDHYPFHTDFVADLRPPDDEEKLRELLLSLPVWELPPEQIQPWIDNNGTLSGNVLRVTGDGAQNTLRLERLATPNQFALKIGTEDWPEGGLYFYTLRRDANRSPKGWEVLSRRSLTPPSI